MISMLQAGKIDECIHLANLHFDGLSRIHTLSNNLVQWVLSAQSGINLNFRRVSLKEVIENLYHIFETELTAKQIKLLNEVNPSTEVFADAACVETICRNIVQNAIKFTDQGKSITVIANSNSNNEGLISLTISDEGVGMPPEILEKLNEGKRMITLGTQGEKGNGLGLIMIQTLLSLNKGKMQIKSEIGVGTQFSILLPANNSSV